MLANLLLLSGMALALILAGVGYASKHAVGKPVFVIGVLIAVGALVLAATACGALPDSAKSERQIADEAVECMLADDGGFAVLFLGGKEDAAEMLVQTSTKEQLIAYRDKECGVEEG